MPEGHWLAEIDEILRLTAPPASAAEICEQGLLRLASALGARNGAIVIRTEDGAPASVMAALGNRPAAELQAAETFQLPLRLEPGAAGAVVLEGPEPASPEARSFAVAAAQAIASALRGARSIDNGREQGARLARRNLQLETLRDISFVLNEGTSEEEILQLVLDHLVDKLGLEAGWIFWGEEQRGRLTLAAARNLPEAFVGPARSGETSPCLCLDVFRTGRLRLARNTTECPRLPDLLGGVRTHACIPLRFERGVLGVLNVAGRSGTAFTREELEFFETVGTQACLAVDKLRTSQAETRAYRETREALVRLQKAQEGVVRAERLATVGTLASSLAHEVRNPLNSISLTLVLLTRRLARLEEPDPSLATMVETVRGEVERLDTLVGEFLSLATLDRLQPEITDPRALVRETLDLVGPLAAAQGIDLRDASSGEGVDVSLDRRKMTQVLLNLLRNAIDAMPRGGVLTAEVKPADKGVEIRIVDTGPGIAPGLDVFSFFTTTKRGGTGLGLPISRGIVEAHGGRLSYDSEPGRGTTFRILLPVARPGAARGAGET